MHPPCHSFTMQYVPPLLFVIVWQLFKQCSNISIYLRQIVRFVCFSFSLMPAFQRCLCRPNRWTGCWVIHVFRLYSTVDLYIRKLTKYFFDFYGFFVPFVPFWTFWTFAWRGTVWPKRQKSQRSQKKANVFAKSPKSTKVHKASINT